MHKTKRGPGALDVVLGQNLRHYRREIQMTQWDLAEQVGISFQQIQKYEQGKNRISAAQLYEFSRILNVPLTAFFTGMPDP